jgi:signal transduction histidine kinase
MSSSFPTASDERAPAPLRVLIVDDSPEDRELYRRLLAAPRGFAVSETDSGAAALRLLAAAEFDCVLLDYQLPDANGIELLQEARQRVARLPAVILLTGRGDEATAVAAMKNGAQDYLVKGRIAGDGLADAITQAVELVRQRTRDLERSNAELRREVEERQRAELSEREARRIAEEANRLKDEFLATLSHELRTPLNAILGWAAVLRAGRPDATMVDRAAAVIERNARAQAQLVSDLLDMSAIITGKLRLEIEPVDVAGVLRAVEDTVRPSALAKAIDLRVAIEPDLPPVPGDASRLQQVVWNLLANAVKFTGRGGRVTLSARRAGDHLEIGVSDDGAGIDADFLPFVFERFRQQDSSRTRRHSGLGLGLAIVRHLVEAHGGTVTADSDGEGRGAHFRVLLPLPSSPPARASSPAAVTSTPCSLTGLRVLLVEDDADTRDLCRLVLEESGATVTVAGNADAAWQAFAEARPDALVFDIGLPGEDGYSLLRRVREAAPGNGSAPPAVALTAYAGPQDIARALQAGFALHLAKPVLPEALVAAVCRLCGRLG